MGGAGGARPGLRRGDGGGGRAPGPRHRPFSLPEGRPDWPEHQRREWAGRREIAALAAGGEAPGDGFAGRWLACQGWVRHGGHLLVPAQSLAVMEHAPSGFAWDYHGSGPAQLALALLLRVTDRETAARHYQAFKRATVAGWPGKGAWRMDRGEVEGWLAAQGR